MKCPFLVDKTTKYETSQELRSIGHAHSGIYEQQYFHECIGKECRAYVEYNIGEGKSDYCLKLAVPNKVTCGQNV